MKFTESFIFLRRTAPFPFTLAPPRPRPPTALERDHRPPTRPPRCAPGCPRGPPARPSRNAPSPSRPCLASSGSAAFPRNDDAGPSPTAPGSRAKLCAAPGPPSAEGSFPGPRPPPSLRRAFLPPLGAPGLRNRRSVVGVPETSPAPEAP